MQPLVLEVTHTPGDVSRTLAFCGAILLLVGSIPFALVKASLLPLIATIVALAWLVWLFRTQPTAQYVQYLTIDNQGLKYVHTPGQRGRVSHFAWGEIQGVSLSLASKGEDVQGISVSTTRPNLGGRSVLLPVFSEPDCIAVQRTVEKYLELLRVARNSDA